MKLLLVGDSLKLGGAERHMVGLAVALKRRGHDVAVATLKGQDELAAELRRGGVEQLLRLDSRGGIDLAALRRMIRSIDTIRPDVLVATSQYSLMYAVLARKFAQHRPGLAFISHSMAVVRRNRQERLRFAVYRHFYALADCVVFVTGLQRTFFDSLGVRLRRTEVVHSGLDLGHFNADAVAGAGARLRAELGFGERDLVIGLCAVFRAEKRHVDLLRAVARLRADGVPARVLLVGDGPTRSGIERCRDELGLGDAVILAGYHQDVRPYIAACDVMTLTSNAEAFPIATLEYMALGKPVVASEVGGMREQVAHGINGMLYPSGDIAALAVALARFADPALAARLGQGALDTVRQRFDLQLMTARYEAVFASLMPGLGAEERAKNDAKNGTKNGAHAGAAAAPAVTPVSTSASARRNQHAD